MVKSASASIFNAGRDYDYLSEIPNPFWFEYIYSIVRG